MPTSCSVHISLFEHEICRAVTKNYNVDLLFRYNVPSLRDFLLNTINNCQEPLYFGQILYVLNGVLHICVKRWV
ncbi:MAG: hypothetical protein ACI9LX_000427 [Paraglaciecola sp.]|jgi:hypothetical protein